MATVLDLSVLKFFSPIFSWLLSFLLVYGFLQVTNVFKNPGVHAMVALAFTLMVAVSSTATLAIASMAPWFMVIIFFIFMVYLISNFMGVGGGEIIGALGGKAGATWWIMIIGFIILAAGLSNAFGQQLLQARQGGNQTAATGAPGSVASPAHGQAVLLTITNPKILGMILLLFIAALTIALMTQR
ncbi:hypothetical protein HYU15_02490 [Candidatus Woesearchaeota archaeon]|nr:hypothetical protein [Candidatus Woesearchaeota archaeon]